jgi:hypothetical protein
MNKKRINVYIGGGETRSIEVPGYVDDIKYSQVNYGGGKYIYEYIAYIKIENKYKVLGIIKNTFFNGNIIEAIPEDSIVKY